MKTIVLTQNKFTIVNNKDFKYLNQFTWFTMKKRNKFYVCGSVNGKKVYMHRLLLNAKKNQYVDHINGNPLDNRKQNLRLCSNSENLRNRTKNSNNTSGFKGVWRNKISKCWIVTLTIKGKSKYFGAFKNKKDAAKAYDKAALKYYKEFAKLNFPKDSK